MYNNFSSKKTKKVISALLASALVVTSGPITADAATAKVVGIKKSITVSASATNKVTGLSKAEKKVVKVTKKGKKFTIKGLKAGKATFKIGKKSYTVKVGATTVKAAKTKLTLTKGKAATLKFTTKSGNGDTLTFKASNKNVTLAKKSAKIAKSAASVKATAKKAGKTTITATSKATGKKATVTVTVKNPAKPATTTPGASNTPVATATGSATNTPEATATATATASGSATNTPDVTATPVATATGTATATPVATGSATNTPEATEVPTEAPTKAPEVVTGGTITVTGTAVSGATIVVTNVSGAAVDATKRLPAGTYTVTVSKEGYETQSKEVVIADKDAKVVEINLEKMIEVAKVEALNLAEIQITFTKALTTTQATEAAKAANYTVRKDAATSDSKIDNVSVSDDKKSVTLLLAAAGKLEQGKAANKVTVAKAIGMFSDYTTTAVKSDDVKVPQITDVTAVGNKMIKVTFSEAVALDNTADDNTTIADATKFFNVYANAETDTNVIAKGLLEKASISKDKKTVTITLKSAQAVGTYKLVVYGKSETPNLKSTAMQPSADVQSDAIKDFAGYAIQDTAKTVEISAAANVAQASTVTVSDRKTVKVKFDGAVAATGTLTWKQGTTTKTSTGVELEGSDTLKYTFADSIATGKVDFTVKGVEDAYGYDVVEKTFTDVTVEAASAVSVSVKVISDDKIEVTFNSKMQKSSMKNSSVAGDAANPANYELKNAKGETISLAGVDVEYTEDEATSTYKTTLSKSPQWDLAAGTYTLTVKDVKNTYGDVMTTFIDTNVVVADTTKPYVNDATVNAAATANDGNNKIAITFNEAMKTSGENAVTNASAYQIKYITTGTYEALPSSATLTASTDGKTVFIEFPYNSSKVVDPAQTTIKVGIVGSSSVTTVADAAGNILDGSKTPNGVGAIGNGLASNETTAEFKPEADVPPTIDYDTTGATYVKDATSLYVKTGVAFGSVDASDFEYTLDGTNWKAAKSASLESVALGGASTASQYLVIGLDDTLNAKTNKATVKVRVAKKAEYKSTSVLGKKLVERPTASENVSKAIASSLVAWPFRAQIVSAEVLSDNVVRVVFDGNVKQGAGNTVENTSNILGNFLEIVNGNTVFTGSELSFVLDGENAVVARVTPAGGKVFSTTNNTVVRTKKYNSVSNDSTNWITDANGTYYVENIAGVAATVATGLKVQNAVLTDATADGVLNKNDDTLVVTFNQSILASSVGSATTATLDTTGTLKIDKVGTISGFEKPATAKEAVAVQVSASNNVVTIKFNNASNNGTNNSFLRGTGSLTFTPANTIKNNFDTAVTVETKDVVGALNAAPEVTGAVASEGTALALTFSEDVYVGDYKFGSSAVDLSTMTKTEKESFFNVLFEGVDSSDLASAISSVDGDKIAFAYDQNARKLTVTFTAKALGTSVISSSNTISVKANAITDLVGGKNAKTDVGTIAVTATEGVITVSSVS
jgi:hypothetical protein